MKKIVGTMLVLVCGILIMLAISSHSEVQVRRSNTDKTYANEFLSDLATMNNNKGISISVGEELISFVDGKPYVSKKGCLMFPVDQLTDNFNCSTQIYENGNILIEKGVNSISLYVNSASAKVNGTTIELADKVQMLNETLYVPLADIAQYINYEFAIDYPRLQKRWSCHPVMTCGNWIV